jgi:hypothetical protein
VAAIRINAALIVAVRIAAVPMAAIRINAALIVAVRIAVDADGIAVV